MIYLRRDSSETKRKILTVCVRLFLEQGYKNTSVSQIVDEAGVARGSYMARKCDIHFPLECKLSRFLTASMRVYRVPEEEQAKVLAFIQSPDIKAIATEAMYKLFTMLEMKYDFKLSKNNEMEETR